ncbi:MAG: chorismate mutase [Mycoplasmataceae bacterium]|jgi:chorismate mutase|nr:chorismate mutase [Mycoplasmataceae bacterium]
MAKNTLIKSRKKIDKIDRKIAQLIIQRFGIVKLVGEYKKANNLPIFVPQREQAVKAQLRAYIGQQLPENAIENIMQVIMDEAKKIE